MPDVAYALTVLVFFAGLALLARRLER